jgi:protein-disulfide isomerase
MKGKILQHLRERRINRIKTEYLASLKKEAKIEVRLMTPRAEVSLANTPVRGSVNAPVMLIEYADYECPYCQQMQPVLDKLESEYKGKIAFAYKDVPLPNHPNAQRAAEASHCAAAQGKYWEYHDILVSKKQLDPAGLKLAAVELKLDSAAFDKCVQSGETTALIRTHLNEAQSLGLQGTPSFFINGRFLNGLLSYENLKEIVEEELKLSAEPQRAGLK